MLLHRPHPFLNDLSFIPFAHRGGTSNAPENTLRSFQNAIDTGYLYLETDVHASADGVLFAFHDSDLQRTCGVPHKIGELQAAEIKQFTVEGTDPIPTLEQLVSAFPHAFFNIDCKADTALEPLIRDLIEFELLDRACVGSFSDRRLRAIRSRFGEKVCTSAGPREVTAVIVGAVSTVLDGQGPNCLQIPMKQGPINLASKRFIDRCQRNGLPVHYWTVDDPADINLLLDVGANGIMTDQPRNLREALDQRTMWPH